MNKALLLDGNKEILVTADAVKNGEFDRHSDFVDVEYKFRVIFVKSAKNNGGPYFRLYYSLEYYKSLSDEQKSYYDIVREMSHYQESEWHRYWTNSFNSFSKIEKVFRNKETGEYKRADAFLENQKLCVEFQHSYIALDFEKRNDFYKKENLSVVWLYDLTQHSESFDDKGNVQILEDNARGFYRIAEEEKDLSDFNVFIQMKNRKIYKVNVLHRNCIKDDKKSTIRWFEPTFVYTENEFIKEIKTFFHEKFKTKSVQQLWSSSFSKMILRDEKGTEIIIYGNNGKMNRDLETNCVSYRYTKFYPKSKKYYCKNEKFYILSNQKFIEPKWKLIYWEDIKNGKSK